MAVLCHFTPIASFPDPEVKQDLSQMGRELKNTIIIDNSPASYLFHPENAVPIESWFDDPDDRDLDELIPFLQECAATADVRVPLRDRYHVT